jgi:hypothetical protein
VDAICINQKDPEEKARQVQIMLTIYQKAKSVLRWLDDAADLDQEGFGFLIWTETDEKRNLPLLPSQGTLARQRMIQTIETLCRRPWFRRTWVRQEYFAGRAVVFVCGGKVIARDRLDMLSRRLPAAAKVKSNDKIDAYRPEEEELEEPFDSIWPSFEADYP